MHCLHEQGSIFGFLRGVGLSECTNIRKGEQHMEVSGWEDRPKEEVGRLQKKPHKLGLFGQDKKNIFTIMTPPLETLLSVE